MGKFGHVIHMSCCTSYSCPKTQVKMADLEPNDLPTIADDLVVTKYKMAAEIVNKVLKGLVTKCTAEASVRDLCILSDKQLAEETAKAFKKDKKVLKGIAFPTCISVNNVICHYSPLVSEPDTVLADGDLVKIDLGASLTNWWNHSRFFMKRKESMWPSSSSR